MSAVTAFAQDIFDRSDVITVFKEYQPAVITLKSGNLNHQRQANVFLKNGGLLYKSGQNIMEANMDQVMSVKFGERQFIKHGSHLVEVVYSLPNGNKIVLERSINIDGFKREILNNSTITNIDMGDLLGVTRVDNGETFSFPVDNVYYFKLGDKFVTCGEREVKHAAGKKRMEAYEAVVNAYGFRWNNLDNLKSLLEIF